MNRKKFIKTSILSGIGISIIPHISFASIQGKFTRNQLIGKGDTRLVGNKHKMEAAAYESFIKMKEKASEENINIQLESAYRSFQRQKEIFEGKFNKFSNEGMSPTEAIEKIIEYSTIPGTSRHHWGTDIDIIDGNAIRPNSVLEAEHFSGSGPYCKMKEWLNHHAESFGFVEVYTDDSNRKGFKYEPWHFSYAPVSKPMLKEYRLLNLKEIMLEEKILGVDYFTESFIDKYTRDHILDINPKLLE